MQLKQLFADDDAVSPVIGVILMVAITVILAAVIGAFVLGIGGDQVSPPQVSWDVSERSDGTMSAANFTHTGGDQIASSASLSASLEGTTVDLPNPDGYSAGATISANDVYSDADGDSLASSDFQNGNTVRIIWSADGSSDTSVIAEHTLADQ